MPVLRGQTKPRVFAIAKLMATGQWNRKVQKALAAEWKVTVGTMKHYAAEAGRLLEWTTRDRKRLLDLVEVRLLEIADQDGNDRVPALRTVLEHLGELRQRHYVTPVRDPFDGWTDEEVERFAATGEKPARLLEDGSGGS